MKKQGQKMFIQEPTNNPLIGSGNISRRIIIIKEVSYFSPKEIKGLKTQNPSNRPVDEKIPSIPNPSRVIKRKRAHGAVTGLEIGNNKWDLTLKTDLRENNVKNHINFINDQCKSIWEEWNNLGPPFVHHRTEPTKTLSNSILAIKRALKKYDKVEIITAMRNCHKLHSLHTFRFYYSKLLGKIRCDQFFKGYTSEEKKSISKKCDPNIIWFKESLKGFEYLQNEYSIMAENKHPSLLKILEDGWKRIHQVEKITVDEKNDLILCTKKIYKFAKMNKVQHLAPDIATAIANWMQKGIIFTSVLNGHYFWESILPKVLIDMGIFESWEKIKWPR